MQTSAFIFPFRTFCVLVNTDSSRDTVGDGRRFRKPLEDDDNLLFLQRTFHFYSCKLAVIWAYSAHVWLPARPRMHLTLKKKLGPRQEKAVVSFHHYQIFLALSFFAHRNFASESAKQDKGKTRP